MLMKLNKTAKRILSFVLVVTMFVSSSMQGYAGETEKTKYDFNNLSLALYSSEENIVINEDYASIVGDMYALGNISYTCKKDNFKVEGNELTGKSYEISNVPYIIDLINASAEYDFTIDKDVSYRNKNINLDESSIYVEGNLDLDQVNINGSGNITALGDIAMNISNAGNDVVIMSEEGNVEINSSKFEFSGLIYAPNGTVIINSKEVDYVGAIIAKSIEINGTELSLTYKDYIPDELQCNAGEDKTIYIEDGVTLNTSCNYSDAKVQFTVEDDKNENVEIVDGNTLTPTFNFKETGEYKVTMKTVINNTTATDEVTIIVKPEPVVTYTTAEDFNNGSINNLSSKNDEIKLAAAQGETKDYSANYNKDNGRGISIDFNQSKTTVNSTEDNLELSYLLSGYGKVEYEKGNDMILLVDNSGSMSSYLKMLKQAALNILEYMGPNDRFGLADLGRVHLNLTNDKTALTNAINRCDSGSYSSDYLNGINNYALEMFDQNDNERDKYILVLADGENDFSNLDSVVKRTADMGVKVIVFQINSSYYVFENSNTYGYAMQEVAAKTKGFYKLSTNADEIAGCMEQFAGEVYNQAGNSVEFSTTIMDESYLNVDNMEMPPTSIVNNEDGSITLTWKYSSIDIDNTETIEIPVKTELLTGTGYTTISKDTTLTYYDRNGEGTIVYLEDVVVGRNDYAGEGQWDSAVYDSGKKGCTWSLVSWNAIYNGNSSIDVYLAVSEDGEKFSEAVKVDNNQELKGISGRYIKTYVYMKKSEDGATPVLNDLTVYSYDDITADNVLMGSRVGIRCEKEVYANTPVAVLLDVQGDNANVDTVEWNITDEHNVLVKNEDLLYKTLTFEKEGTYTIEAEITTEDGLVSKAAVNVLVEKQPSINKADTDEGVIPELVMNVTETPLYLTNITNTTIDFQISFSDPSQITWCRVVYYATDNYSNVYARRAAYVDKNGNVTISYSMTNGEYTIVIEAFDKYGNCVTETRKVLYDGIGPVVKLTASKSNIYVYQNTVVTATATDNNGIASEVFTINDEVVELDENGQYEFTSLVAGKYVAKYVVTDVAGNVKQTTYNITVMDDTAMPIALISASNSMVLGNSQVINVTTYDNQSGLKNFAVTVNGETVETTSIGNNVYTFELTPSEIGTYEIVLTAEDNKGNINTVTRTIECMADTSRPYVNVKLSNAEVIAGDDIVVTVTASDNVSVTELYLYEDGVEKTLSEDNTYVYTSDDANLNSNGYKYVAFKVVARDNAGNESSATISLKVIKEDTQKPTATIGCNSTISIYSNAYIQVTVGDNIAVAETELFVNGEEVELDANNRYTLLTDDFYTYDIKLVVTDTSGNVAESTKTAVVADVTYPTVTITKNKSTYVMGDTATFTVKSSDNYKIDKVVATYDGTEVEAVEGEFVCEVDDVSAGTHKFEVTVTDTSGNSTTRYVSFTVADTEAPTVSVSTDKEKYAVDEIPVIDYIISDNMEIATVEAYINDEAVEYVDGKLKLPNKFGSGVYVIYIKATDTSGNSSEAECTFEIMKSSDVICPKIGDCTLSPAHWQVGTESYITVDATDNSGTVDITLSVKGKELEYDETNNRFKFTPDSEGYVEILIHAEDETGNYTEAILKKYVYQSLENHKLKVNAENVISVNQKAVITLSSTDNCEFTQTSVLCNTTGEYLIEENGIYTFSSDSLGKYTFTAYGTDNEGITDKVEFTITVASQYEAEINSEAMKQYLETTTETSLTNEMLEVMDDFENPVDAYSYVINNIRYECYVNSRRGGIGAFETKYGNDYDQASLLIGFLREMGYPARYVKGNITLTEEQLNSLFAAEDYASVCQMFANSGRNIVMNSAQKILKLDQVWVEVYVPYSMTGVTDETYKDLGVWVALDTSIKASKLDTYSMESEEELVDFSAQDDVLDNFETTEIADIVEEIQGKEVPDSLSERNIVEKEYTVLPSSLQYTVNSQSSTFAQVTDAMSDRVSFTVSDVLDSKSLGTYRTADLYNKRVSVQYVGDTGSATIFEMSKSQVAYNTFRPALTIDGNIVSYGPETTLGNKQELIVSIKGAVTESFVDEIEAGSMYSVMLDTGKIAYNTYEKLFNDAVTENPMEENEKAPTKTSYYSEAQVGSYLAFCGAMYFINCDRYEYINECTYNIESSSRTKCAVVGYNVNFEENNYGMYTKVLPGRFFIDVNLNTNYSVSRTGDVSARNTCMFSSSMIGSYFEGAIWEYLLLQDGVSTMHIFFNAAEQGNELKLIYDYNYNEMMDELTYLDSGVKNDIKSAVNSGYCVMIPDSKTNIGKWSGTGYMIADFKDYNYFVYRISGGINGGTAVDVTALDYILESELTEELFEENNIDLLDYYCNTFAICQSLYSFLMMKNAAELAGTVYAANLFATIGVKSIGSDFDTGFTVYDSMKNFNTLFTSYAGMIESVALYCDSEIEGVRKITAVCTELVCLLTGVDSEILSEVLKIIVAGKNGDIDEADDASDNAGKKIFIEVLKKLIKKSLVEID